MTCDELECAACKYKWRVEWNPLSTLDQPKACCPRCKTTWEAPQGEVSDVAEKLRGCGKADCTGHVLLDCTACEDQLICDLRKEPVDIAACPRYVPVAPAPILNPPVNPCKLRCAGCNCEWADILDMSDVDKRQPPRCPYCDVPVRVIDECLSRPLPSATILRLEPGDVLVFKYSQSLSDPQRDKLKGYVDECFPGHDYMILEREMDLQTVRPAKATEAS